MTKTNYLEGLNTLRFFLAIIVLLGHCNQNLVGYSIFWFSGASVMLKGGLCIEFFFVLSGFILTHIAYKEMQKSRTICIEKFFIRRALRILPLYYLAVILGYLILGIIYPFFTGEKYLSFSIAEGLPYHLFLLPNLLISNYNNNIGSLYSLWSIGVEEQFYLFFPFLMNRVLMKKNSAGILFSLALLYFIFYFLVLNNYILKPSNEIIRFITSLKFHFMLIGGGMSLLSRQYESIVKEILTTQLFQTVIWIMIIIFFFFSIDLYDKYHIFQGFVFSILILIVSNKNYKLINIEKKPFVYLGSLSYGIYLFHPLISYFLRFLMERNVEVMVLVTFFPILYYFSEIIITLIIAYLSYNSYEKFFLKLKPNM
jgi:peptidoglycan/LPS O-acetylase OafA/YrhL